MASHITYDGVSGAAGGGNIFEGMKFWVSRWVPSRDWIIDNIQNNSGTVVPLEKDADMLIADHARKDVPLGSYSWKYITESVKAGIVQVEDKYLNGPPPNQPRSVLTGSRARKTRTPFTQLDDAILAKHVLQQGIHTAGNKMYQDMETEHPQHTWQSWRNRWVKILSLRSNHDIDRLARMANLDVDNAPITARHIIRRHEREDWPQPPQPPQQTRDVAGRSDENARRRAEPSPRATRAARRDTVQRQETTSSENLNAKSTADEVASEQNGDGTEKDSTPYHDAPTGEEQEQERVEDSEVESEGGQEEEGGENAEEVVEEENVEEDEDEGEEEEAEAEEAEEEEEEGGGAEDETGFDRNLSSFTERDQFYSDLQDYCEANDRELEKQCVIRDKRIDLWDLFQAVSTQSLPLEEVDWRRVAQYVGFSRAQSKEIIATLLQTSYHRHIAGFVEAMLSFEGALDEDSEEGEEIVVSTGEAAAEASQRNDGTPSRSGSGKAKARKRLSDGQSLTPENISKRRRTIEATIPVTPEGRKKTRRRVSAPASALGHLGSIVDDDRTQGEDSQHRSPMILRQRQWSPEEPADNTPSQQLRSESDSVASPEHGDKETPTRHHQARSSGYHFNDRGLETIMEEEPSTSTPTKPRSKKRSLPSSFQEPQTMHPHERRRLQEQEQQQEESIQEEEGPEEQQQTEEENWKTKEFHKWTKHYREAGYSDDIIFEAMHRTSWIPGVLMEKVLKSLENGEEIPTDVQGIWTYRDDEKLKYIGHIGNLEPAAEDSSELQRRKAKAKRMLDQLLYKHTKSGVELRIEIHQEIAKKGGKKIRR
ncbi:TRF2-interacting telomeric protein/Rap1 C terminal domain-containing protein [Trichoderma evansii]